MERWRKKGGVLTVEVLARSYGECWRRRLGGEERIFCSRRERARLRLMARVSLVWVAIELVGVMMRIGIFGTWPSELNEAQQRIGLSFWCAI